MKTLLIAVIASATLVVCVRGQDQPQPTEVERLREIQAIEDARASLKKLQALTNEMSTTKRLKCMMAFGSAPFCECLSEKTPIGASFENYIRITTTSKEDLEYADLDAEWKSLVDNTLTARESCVTSIFRTPTPAAPRPTAK